MLKTLQNLRNACDFIIQSDALPPGERPHSFDSFLDAAPRIHDGASVFVKSNQLDRFFAVAFPKITARIALVTGASSAATPGRHRQHLDDPRIVHWFGQNVDLAQPHAKFTPLPIGFMDECWEPGNQAALMRLHRAMPRVEEKPLQAYASFQFNRSHADRNEVLRIVRELPGIVVEPAKLPAEALWARHADFAFAISPRGSGFDCHRTWEAILLRTMPIVRSSHVDPLYDGWPVAIVDDWREITPETMAKWREQLRSRFTDQNFARLTFEYWRERITSP